MTPERAKAIHLWRTYYVEDDCISQKHLQKVIYNVPANGLNSVGELRTNRFGTYSRAGRSCLIKLVPPDDYGVVVTVKKVDFRNHEPCEDYIKIYSDDDEGEKLCGFQDNGKDGKSFYSDGKMKILYHTEDGGYGFNDGFRIIFTVAKNVNRDDDCSIKNQFKCANSRCIWAGALCDGFNNCGDASDESTGGRANCPTITPITVAVIALGITTFIAVMISICVCCCRVQQAADKLKEPTDFPSRPNGGYIPLPGYTYTTPDSTAGHILFSPYHSTYPTAPLFKRTSEFGGTVPSPLDLPPPYKP